MFCIAIWLLFSVCYNGNARNILTNDCLNRQANRKLRNECEVTYTYDQESPLFRAGQGMFVDTQLLGFTSSSKNAAEECTLKINVENVLERKTQNSSVVVQQIFISCLTPTKVTFCQPGNFITNDVILYIIMKGFCRVTGADLAVWGRAADLRALHLLDHVWLEDEGETKADLEGLFDIGTLTLSNLKNGEIPRMFLTYIWKKMAEVEFSKIQVESALETLKITMPYLQSLELSGNNLRTLPSFPWCNTSLVLPRHLSRTFAMNKQYSSHATIYPYVYRRFFVVNFNPKISNFVFPSGRLDKISLRGNQLKTINSTMFDGVTGLTDVDLSVNKISHLPERIFTKTHDLVSINLHRNRLTSLNGKMFERLVNLRMLKTWDTILYTTYQT